MAYYYHGGRTMSYGKCYVDAHNHGGRPPMMSTTDERYDAHSHGGRPPMMSTTDEYYYKEEEIKTHKNRERAMYEAKKKDPAYHEHKEASY